MGTRLALLPLVDLRLVLVITCLVSYLAMCLSLALRLVLLGATGDHWRSACNLTIMM